jgi:hypothetical protein
MNNRQAGRRGRGRNNNSNNNNRNNNRGSGGGMDRDNRIDNRARGNAAQMLDKYKKMAQDAQVNDDRVNAEYYLQFADHYFRVNADTVARREEQRLAREERDQRDNESNQKDDGERQNRPPRERQQRDNRPQKDDRNDDRNESRNEAVASEDNDQAEPAEEKKPVRARRPRKTESKTVANPINAAAAESNGLDASALPPAISISSDSDVVKVEKKPVRKKRVAKPKPVAVEASDEGDAA